MTELNAVNDVAGFAQEGDGTQEDTSCHAFEGASVETSPYGTRGRESQEMIPSVILIPPQTGQDARQRRSQHEGRGDGSREVEPSPAHISEVLRKARSSHEPVSRKSSSCEQGVSPVYSPIAHH